MIIEAKSKAFTRRVFIKPDGRGNYQSDAWSIHNRTGKKIYRGCAIHPGLDGHMTRAKDWTDGKELYFF